MIHDPNNMRENKDNDPNAETSAETLSDQELYTMLEQLCESKAEEFRMLGYEQVTSDDIWECVNDNYRKTGIPPVHRIVNDILTLKPAKFMNYLTLRIYQNG
jgi:hypothetical protein